MRISGLMPKEGKVFAFIKAAQGRPVLPSYGDICVACGIKHRPEVGRIMARLVAKGWIKREPGSRRWYEIIDPVAFSVVLPFKTGEDVWRRARLAGVPPEEIIIGDVERGGASIGAAA